MNASGVARGHMLVAVMPAVRVPAVVVPA